MRAAGATDQEKAQIEANAEAAGLDVGSFLRKVGTGTPGPRTRRRRITGDMAELARLRAELARVGNNLNQLTRLANIGDMERPAMLDAALAELLALLAEVRTAMGGVL